MSFQILTLKLDGITAGDYLTWCRDPDPPALDSMLRSIPVDADPLGNTITAVLDWNPPVPAPAGVQIRPLLAGDVTHKRSDSRGSLTPRGGELIAPAALAI